MDEILSSSDERFYQAFQVSPAANLIVRRSDGAIVELNAACLRITGYARHELVGQHIDTLQFMAESALSAELAASNAQNRDITDQEINFTRKDGSTGYGLYSNHPMDLNGQRYGLSMLIDITERKQIEQSLRDSTMRLEATLEGGRMGTWIWNSKTGEMWWDDAATRLWGRSSGEPMPQPIGQAMQFVHPKDRERVDQAFRDYLTTGQVTRLEFRTMRPDGGLQWIGVRVGLQNAEARESGRLIGVFVDITAEKRAEEAQLRSQKMEALGTLAGGIAHDFNNILLAINGNTKLAIADLPSEHPVQRSLREIDRAGARATDLVRRILTFSRQQEPRREIASLRPIIEEALRLIRPTLPAMIEIRTRLTDAVPQVAVDAIQIHQIIMNLATNAAYAIDTNGGLIEISLHAIVIGADGTPAGTELAPGKYARLTFSDTGSGMDRETRERIFDPFFTTKPAGQGTGLGLSVVHGIVKNLGGTIAVHSQPGKGTTFQIYFPAVEAASQPNTDTAQAVMPGQGQRVLYVDDEDALVFLVARVLKRLGYLVQGYSDPSQALTAVRDQPHAFDVVVTDLSMHTMSGFDLARAMLAIRPDLPILLTSGYIRAEDRETARECGIREVILKPDTVEELGHALNRLFAELKQA